MKILNNSEYTSIEGGVSWPAGVFFPPSLRLVSWLFGDSTPQTDECTVEDDGCN